MHIGSGYLGSSILQTSVANEEIIPFPPTNRSTPYKIQKLGLMNEADCTILINNKTKIFLKAGQGFSTTVEDQPITSLKIIESGVKFNWVGGYR